MTNATNGRADAVKFEKYTATNVVFGKTVTVSGTTYSGDPSYLTDGILLDETNVSRWRGDIPSTVDFDLGTEMIISSADIYTGYFNGASYDSFVFDLKLQFWDGISWQDINGAHITSNENEHVRFSFSEITTKKVRLSATAGAEDIARFYEVQIWGNPKTTGISSALLPTHNLSTYPNPVRDLLHVNLSGTVNQEATINIISFDGKVMKTQQVKSSENVSVINLSPLPHGLYVCYYSNGTKIRTAKIIKQ
jgi:hypothetical protein